MSIGQIENFIGVYDNALSVPECNSIIEYYKYMRSLNLNVNYKNYSNGNGHERSDETVFPLEPDCVSVPATHGMMELFTKRFWPCYESYVEQFSVLRAATKHGMNFLRIQHTLPGQGFHQWHFENGSISTSIRLVTFILYLNDNFEAGETEFLYLHKRYKPKAGTLVIWPSGYTHTHRGNPPLTGEKFIVTGWLDLME